MTRGDKIISGVSGSFALTVGIAVCIYTIALGLQFSGILPLRVVILLIVLGGFFLAVIIFFGVRWIKFFIKSCRK